MKVELIRYPNDDDWMIVKSCTLVTVGKEARIPPTAEWKHKLLKARHSPIRELRFLFRITDLPSWVSVHLVRHHEGCQPYVRSQRNDRQDDYDRTKAPQDAPVDMMWSMNAEALMNIANKRLCNQASPETRAVVAEMCNQVIAVCPEFEGLLVPMCKYHGGRCDEMFPCRKENNNESIT